MVSKRDRSKRGATSTTRPKSAASAGGRPSKSEKSQHTKSHKGRTPIPSPKKSTKMSPSAPPPVARSGARTVSGRFIDIPRSVAAPYEIAAALATALAYPELDETGDRFFEVQAAFCGYHLRKVASQDPQWQWSTRVVVPGYLFLSEDEIASRLTGFPTRLAYRMIAAEIVIPFLKAFEAGEKPPRDLPGFFCTRRFERVCLDGRSKRWRDEDTPRNRSSGSYGRSRF